MNLRKTLFIIAGVYVIEGFPMGIAMAPSTRNYRATVAEPGYYMVLQEVLWEPGMLTCARSSVRFRQRYELEGAPLALGGPEGVLGDHPAEHTGRAAASRAPTRC